MYNPGYEVSEVQGGGAVGGAVVVSGVFDGVSAGEEGAWARGGW
jgi:hypothetical protein